MKTAKTINLLLVTLFTFAMLFSGLPGHLQAQIDSSANSGEAVQLDTTAKAKGKKAMEIPTNIDINTANQQLLTRLPGIGPVTAEAIVQYRQSNGLFKSHEELTGVKGIGSKTLARLKPYLQQI